MRVSTLAAAASLLAFAQAQDFTIQTNTDAGGPTTLPPDQCADSLDSCNILKSTLPHEAFTIVTYEEEQVPASLTDSVIPTNDPLLTQTDRLVIDGVTPDVPTSAVVTVSWFESSSTFCDPYEATVTYFVNLPDPCIAATNIPPPTAPSIKTRVVFKPREDVGKDPTEPGNDQSSPTPGSGPTSPIPGETEVPPSQGPTEPTQGPTEGPTEGSPTETIPTDGPSETSSDDTPTGTDTTVTTESAETSTTETSSSSSDLIIPTDSNVYTTETTSESTTLTSSRRTSPTSTTGSTSDDREEVETSFTTIASVSDGVTRFHTKPVATITRESDDTSTTGSPAAGAHNTIVPGILAIALGLGALVGL